MVKTPFLDSFLDQEVVAGYTWGNILEFWWIGLIILIVAAGAVVGTYFALNWFFGRNKFKDGDKEKVEDYDNASKGEKKEVAKTTSGPAKNVIKWKRMRAWFIPTVLVSAIILAPVVSFLPTSAMKRDYLHSEFTVR
jgi:uncharacterized membrane protein YhaH (DUF805 family)